MAQPRELRVAVSEAQVVQFPRPAQTVFIADPTIADVQVAAPTTVIVFGKKPGETTLVAIDGDGKPLAKIQIIVGFNYADLRRLIARDVPKADITVTPAANGVVLSGSVPNDEIAEKVRAEAQRYVSDKDAIINRLQVTGPDQVNLRLRVAEVSRSLTKQLGFNWETFSTVGSFAIGLSTGRVFLNPGTIAGLTTIQRAPPLTGVTSGVSAGGLFGAFTNGRNSINSLIDALAEEGVVSVLAQPNLTAESGQVASFLAGGEFPIPVAQTGTAAGGAAAITVQFKPFGVRLDFVPTVLSGDKISIKVRPEVSELTTNGSVTINGLTIPALNVRRAETTVRLGSGQSFAIAGLIRKNNATDISKYPGLGDLPILGALFRSSQFQHNETELVIIVTPYVVRPVGEGQSLKLPTDGAQPASDVERIILERLTRILPPGAVNPLGPGGVELRGDAGFIYQ
jgi:pilus assembly protein CpaC